MATQNDHMRFVAFPETEYDEVLLGYQPGQMVFSPLNHLTRLIARENFIRTIIIDDILPPCFEFLRAYLKVWLACVVVAIMNRHFCVNFTTFHTF
jgi:hypothetical protein